MTDPTVTTTGNQAVQIIVQAVEAAEIERLRALRRNLKNSLIEVERMLAEYEKRAGKADSKGKA